MPQYSDTRMIFQEDVLDTFVMSPPQPIGGWTVEARISKRFGIGASGIIVMSAASGYGGGASGITITDSGAGKMTFPINSPATSGWQPGPYATTISRLDSGSVSVLYQGFLLIGPR